VGVEGPEDDRLINRTIARSPKTTTSSRTINISQ